MIPQDVFGCLLHGREGTPGELIGVDDDIDTVGRKFGFRDRVKRGRDNDNRRCCVKGAERVAEGKDFRRVLFAAVNHDAVGSGFDIRLGTREGIFHPFFQNQAFDAGNDHKVIGKLYLFARGNLLRKVLNRILRLLDFGSEKRIFLKSRFVFDDNGRNAHAFQRAHRV